MKNWLNYFFMLSTLMSSAVFSDSNTISSELSLMQNNDENTPTKKSQTSFTSTFLYFTHQKHEYEVSSPKYTPGIRLEGSLPIGSKWGIDVQAAYSEFAWAQEKTDTITTFTYTPGFMYKEPKSGNVVTVETEVVSSTNIYTTLQRNQTTFYDFVTYFGRSFFIKTFEIKPVFGAQFIYNISHTKWERTQEIPYAYLTKTWILTPAFGSFFSQSLYKAFCLSGFLGLNLNGELRGSIGFESAFILKSQSKFSLGVNCEAQSRSIRILKQESRDFPFQRLGIYGFSLSGKFDF